MKDFTNGKTCPECNSKEYMYGFLWNSGEEYFFCSECGYKFVFDSGDETVIKESKVEFSTEDLISELPNIHKDVDYFAYYIIENSLGWALSGPLNDSQGLDEFLKYMEEIKPKTNITKVTLGRFIDGKFISEVF